MVFLEALRRTAAVRFENGSALPWLVVVATNLARNQARTRRRYRSMLARLPAPDPEADELRFVHGDDSREVFRVRRSQVVSWEIKNMDGKEQGVRKARSPLGVVAAIPAAIKDAIRG